MNKIVFDASSMLAVLNREPGADKLRPEMLSPATSSTVNLAEVQGKLVSLGLAPGDAWEATLSPIREATAFTAEHAEAGLVIGRPSLSSARNCPESTPVYTADKS